VTCFSGTGIKVITEEALRVSATRDRIAYVAGACISIITDSWLRVVAMKEAIRFEETSINGTWFSIVAVGCVHTGRSIIRAISGWFAACSFNRVVTSSTIFTTILGANGNSKGSVSGFGCATAIGVRTIRTNTIDKTVGWGARLIIYFAVGSRAFNPSMLSSGIHGVGSIPFRRFSTRTSTKSTPLSNTVNRAVYRCTSLIIGSSRTSQTVIRRLCGYHDKSVLTVCSARASRPIRPFPNTINGAKCRFSAKVGVGLNGTTSRIAIGTTIGSRS